MKKFNTSLVLLLVGIGSTAQTNTAEADIIKTVSAIFSATDARNWNTVEAQFAPKVLLDYTSMAGGEPATLSPKDITTSWKTILPGFASTHHQVGNFNVKVEGSTATLTCDGVALHYLPHPKGNNWIVVGSYSFELKKNKQWQVTAMKFNFSKQEGNLELPAKAKESVANNTLPKTPNLSAKDSKALEQLLNSLKTKEITNKSTMNTSIKKTEFNSEGLVLVGNLHLPANFDSTKKYKGIVVTGSWTTVKEQMPDLYAKKMAEQGYVALTFDFRNYGESEGQPRNYESPKLKSQDITNAVNYLKSLDYIDAANIGGLGVCASAGYMSTAAANGADFKAVNFVAPWLHNNELVHMIYGGEEGVGTKLSKAKAAKEKFDTKGEVDYVPAISTADAEAAMFGEFDYYLNPQRGAIKEWGNQFAVMAWENWLKFDPIQLAPQISTPIQIIHSQAAAVPQGAQQFYDQLKGEKNIIWLENVQQFDFYDQEKYTQEAATLAAKWFNEKLD